MPIRLPPGSLATALCRPEECKGCEHGFGEYDPYVARLALSPLLRDGMAMAALRADWLPFAGDQALSRLDDQQLLDAIGGALATGRLRLCPGAAAEPEAETQAEPEGERQAITTSTPPPAPPAPARAAPPPPSAAPPPPPPAPPPEPEIDAAAQTAVLLAAARDGVPFCEECEKARREREAQAA